MAHVEPLMEEDEQTSLGPAIDREQADVQVATNEGILVDIGH